MNHIFRRPTAMIAGLIMGLCVTSQPVQAATFGHKEVEQSKFIALAVPIGGGERYKLMIVEQISNKRPCWQEKPSGVVDPLLTQFDFTGICGRSLDSNGYSIRVANQDLWVNYQLSLIKRNGVLALVGYPYTGGNAHLPIGRTQTTTSGFLKINLDPGWRFTKRTYQGKTLGHVYLTRDTMPPIGADAPRLATTSNPRLATTPKKIVPSAPKTTKLDTEATTPSQHAAAPLTEAVDIPVPPPPTTESVTIPVASPGTSAPPLQARDTQSSSYRVIVPVQSASRTQALKALVPDAFQSTYQGQSVYQVGSFESQRKANAMVQLLQLEGFKGIVEAR